MVSGTVYDAGGDRLPGVVVSLVEEANVGTTTDIKGCFELSLPSDKKYTLKISYLGYVTQYKKLETKKSNPVNVYLQEEVVNLDLVVVNSYPRVLKRVPIATRVITKIRSKIRCHAYR